MSEHLTQTHPLMIYSGMVKETNVSILYRQQPTSKQLRTMKRAFQLKVKETRNVKVHTKIYIFFVKKLIPAFSKNTFNLSKVTVKTFDNVTKY